MNPFSKERWVYFYPQKKFHASIKIAVIYPNSYEVGSCNLGFINLFHKLNLEHEFYVERFFFDKTNPQLTLSSTKKFNLKDADIILLSISYELDLMNFLSLLQVNGIEIERDKRQSDILIGAGGIFATLNPLIFCKYIDFVSVGEIENYLQHLIDSIKKIKNLSKESFVQKVSSIKNIINCSENIVEKKVEISSPEELLTPCSSAYVNEEQIFSNRFLIEISRSCKFRCSFCMVKDVYSTFKTYPADKILETVSLSSPVTNKVGLVSASTLDHPDIFKIVSEINRLGSEVSFSSLRADKITDDFLKLFKINKQKTLTLAPETASDKLRKIISKKITNEVLFSAIEKALQHNLTKFKLYYLIGLPEESDDDIYKIVETAKQLRKRFLLHAKEKKVMPQLILSVNQFIPKPYSKLCNHIPEDTKLIDKKVKLMKKHLLPLGNIKIEYYGSASGNIQWLLSNYCDEELLDKITTIIKEKRILKELNHLALSKKTRK